MNQRSFASRALQKTILLLNAGVAICLFISQICMRVSPEEYWFCELIAISYPYLLIINLAFIAFWLIIRWRFAFVSIIIILIGYNHLGLFLQWNSSEESTDVKTFSVLSYNVRLFDLYNWTGNLKTRAQIFDFLDKEQADFICFQEYYNADKGDFQNTRDLKKFLQAENAHVEYGITLRKTDHWGLATFSRYPIVGKGKVIYEEGKTNFGIYTDVKVDDDTLRIYNVHLQSNHFKEKDYRFIEVPDSGSNEQIISASKNILRRLKAGAEKRAQQVDDLKVHMNNSPYPVILCGDFNDPPFSYAYHILSNGLTDSFTEFGKGTGVTYIGKIPFFRIDYILCDDAFRFHDHQVRGYRYSDHKPLLVRMSIRKEE